MSGVRLAAFGVATVVDNAAIAAAVGAQAACAAALTAAAGVAIPSVAQNQAGLASAVAVAVGAQAACEAAISASWGTVLTANHQHADIAVSEIVPAPAAAYHLEVLSVTVNCSGVPAGDVASFVLAADGDGLDIYRTLKKGDSWTESAVSPDKPLYVCPTATNLGIGALAIGTIVVVDVQYRVVPD